MFLKGRIRRFNDQIDDKPGPGSYDPKFETDIATSTKAPIFPITNPNSKDRPGSATVSRSPSNSFLRMRSSSFQRPFSADSNRRNSSQPPLLFNKFRISKLVSQDEEPTNMEKKDEKKNLDCLISDIRHGLILSSKDASTNTSETIKNPKVKITTTESPPLNIQITDLKELVAEKTIKNQLLMDERETYQTLVAAMKMELNQLETEKSDWLCSEMEFIKSIKLLQDSNGQLQGIAQEFQNKFMYLKEEITRHQIEFATMEEKYLKDLALIQIIVKEKQTQMEDSEKKCLIVITELESYREASKEKFEKLKSELNKKSLEKEKEMLKSCENWLLEVSELKQKLEHEKLIRVNKDIELVKLQESVSTLGERISILTQKWAEKEEKQLKTISEKEEQIQTLTFGNAVFLNGIKEMKIPEMTRNRLEYEKLLEDRMMLLQEMKIIPGSGSKEFHLSSVLPSHDPISPKSHSLTSNSEAESNRTDSLGQELSPKVENTDYSVMKKRNDDLKLMAEEFRLKSETRTRKQESTKAVIDSVIKDNEKMKEQINSCNAVLKLDRGEISDVQARIRAMMVKEKLKSENLTSEINPTTIDDSIWSQGEIDQSQKEMKIVYPCQKKKKITPMYTFFDDTDLEKFRPAVVKSRPNSPKNPA